MFHFPLYTGRRSRELVWVGVSIYTSEISNKLGWNLECVFVYVTDDGNLMTNVVRGRVQAYVTTMTDNDEDEEVAGVDSAMGSSSCRDNNARRWTRTRSCVPNVYGDWFCH